MRVDAGIYVIVAGMLSIAWPCAACRAQVVQLPSYRSFSSSGSALVPDSGAAMLGGTYGGATGSSRSGWGPYSSGSMSANAGGSTLSATVQIIDLDALDAAILANGETDTAAAPHLKPDTRAASATLAARAGELEKGNRPDWDTHKSATYLADNVSQRTAADPGRWQRALAGGWDQRFTNFALLESDIRYYLMKGQDAESAGHIIAARVYYKLARDAMSPELTRRYLQIVAQRQAAEEARIKAEIESGRRNF